MEGGYEGLRESEKRVETPDGDGVFLLDTKILK
jgi:hypothetical protein